MLVFDCLTYLQKHFFANIQNQNIAKHFTSDVINKEGGGGHSSIWGEKSGYQVILSLCYVSLLTITSDLFCLYNYGLNLTRKQSNSTAESKTV